MFFWIQGFGGSGFFGNELGGKGKKECKRADASRGGMSHLLGAGHRRGVSGSVFSQILLPLHSAMVRDGIGSVVGEIR